ncbi:hypothetical protein AAKU64_003837 [Undibacterium sp. GrIS 1.8]
MLVKSLIESYCMKSFQNNERNIGYSSCHEPVYNVQRIQAYFANASDSRNAFHAAAQSEKIIL